MASKIRPPSRLRFCPACADAERASSGEAYWHRLHQVPGIFICPIHRMFLEESSVQTTFRRTRHEFMAAENVIPATDGTIIDQDNGEHTTLLRIARSANWLLNNYCPGNDLAELRARYIHQAMKLGLVSGC